MPRRPSVPPVSHPTYPRNQPCKSFSHLLAQYSRLPHFDRETPRLFHPEFETNDGETSHRRWAFSGTDHGFELAAGFARLTAGWSFGLGSAYLRASEFFGKRCWRRIEKARERRQISNRDDFFLDELAPVISKTRLHNRQRKRSEELEHTDIFTEAHPTKREHSTAKRVSLHTQTLQISNRKGVFIPKPHNTQSHSHTCHHGPHATQHHHHWHARRRQDDTRRAIGAEPRLRACLHQ